MTLRATTTQQGRRALPLDAGHLCNVCANRSKRYCENPMNGIALRRHYCGFGGFVETNQSIASRLARANGAVLECNAYERQCQHGAGILDCELTECECARLLAEKGGAA